ncbi:MAG: NADH-ubiquinone oxidoreductase chain J, partial [uncultured Solirubrobacteraceae bacterium]
GGSRLLHRCLRRDRRSDRDRGHPQPVLLRAGAGLAPARPRRAVPAAARGVPRRRAGGRLRGRRDGALRLRRRLHRRRPPVAGSAERPGHEDALRHLRRRAARRAVHRHARLRPHAARHRGHRLLRRLRHAGRDRPPAADQVPDRLRGRLAAAADRRRGRGRARAPPRGGPRDAGPPQRRGAAARRHRPPEHGHQVAAAAGDPGRERRDRCL